MVSKGPKKLIKIQGEEINIQDEVTYLGQLISFKNRREKELSMRIKKSWKNFWPPKSIFKSNMDLKLKTTVWQRCTMAVLMYSAQTWALTKTNLDKLRSTQSAMERSILGIRRKDRARNDGIRNETKMVDIGYKSSKIKWKYAGHITRQIDDRWEKRVEEWIPHNRKRSKGRPITRWEDEIVKEVRPLWSRLAHNRKKWKKCGEAYAQKRAGTGRKKE